jgi:hypothetical protein
MDDGEGGDFVSINGFSPYSMVTHFTVYDDIRKGRVHRFQYRAKNAVGWGPWSPEASILAASPPSAPAMPQFSRYDSATDKLYVILGPSEDNGGTAITDMELWRDGGDDFSSAFTKVANYNWPDLEYGLTLGAAGDGLVKGKIYRMYTTSKNKLNIFSPFSNVAYIAFGDVSSLPGQANKV